MERRAKDGTYYKQVGDDQWTPVTRTAKDGTVYKKVGDDQWSPLEQPKPDQETNALQAFGNKLADSAFLGYGSEISAITGKGMDNLVGYIKGLDLDDQTYAERVAERDRLLAKGAEEHPYASGAGTVAGIVGGSAGVGAGLKAVGLVKAVPSSKAAAETAGKALTLKQRAGLVGQRVVQNAKEGAAFGALTDSSVGSDGSIGDDLAERGMSTALSAAISGAVPVAGAALRTSGRIAAAAPKKILSSTLGVSEENIDKYLLNSERINKARGIEDLKSDVDEVIGKIRGDLADQKLSVRDAQKALAESSRMLKEQASKNKGEAALAFRDARTRILDEAKALNQQASSQVSSARQGFKEAKGQLDASFKSEVNALKQTPAPTHMAGEVTQSVENLKRMVINGSDEAMDILEREGKPVSLDGIPQKLDEIANGLKIEGKFLTPTAERAHNFIRDIQRRLYEMPVTISGTSAKRYLKQLDKEITYAQSSGRFTDIESQALGQIRHAVDDILKKQSDGYAQKMAEVAENARLLSVATKRGLGDVHTVTSKLSSIDSSGRAPDRELLAAIGSKLGVDFDGPIAQYTKTRETLKNQLKLEAIRNGLPENEAVKEAEKALLMAEDMLNQTKTKTAPRELRRQLVEAPEAERLRRAKEAADPTRIREQALRSEEAQALNAQRMKLAEAEKAAKMIPGLTENTSENQIRQMMKGGSIGGRQKFNYVSKKAGKNLTQEIQDRGVLESFDTEFRNGSRNVNLGGILGMSAGKGILGGAVGYGYGDEAGGTAGLTIGALSGALSNTYGPRMTKVILDQIIKVQALPAAKRMAAMQLPEGIKRELPAILRRSGVVGSEVPRPQMPKVADQENGPKKGPEKWAATGFQRLMQHASPADQEKLKAMREELMKPGRARAQLFEASDLKAGSEAMDRVLLKILKTKTAWDGKK